MQQNQAGQGFGIDKECKGEENEQTEGNATSTSETEEISAALECNKETHTAPEPKGEGYEPPSYPAESFYTDELPEYEDELTKATYNASLLEADKTYDQSIMVAETAREAANAVHTNAMKKANLAVTLLQKEVGGTIVVAKQQSWADYKKCLYDALPKNCKSVEEVPEKEKTAVCAAALKKSLAEKDLEYETEIQTICQERADAERAWATAQEQYAAAKRIAGATREVARKAAEVAKYTALATAYEASCMV